jgi:hypothetical protein
MQGTPLRAADRASRFPEHEIDDPAPAECVGDVSRQLRDDGDRGEMAGVGLSVGATAAKTDRLVVEAICDWGYAENRSERGPGRLFVTLDSKVSTERPRM